MFSTKNERVALLISTILFGLLAIVQLWRFFTDTAVVVGGHSMPTWPSLLLGLVALAMAFWLGVLLRHRRPIV